MSKAYLFWHYKEDGGCGRKKLIYHRRVYDKEKNKHESIYKCLHCKKFYKKIKIQLPNKYSKRFDIEPYKLNEMI